jgi:hypothetical protein
MTPATHTHASLESDVDCAHRTIGTAPYRNRWSSPWFDCCAAVRCGAVRGATSVCYELLDTVAGMAATCGVRYSRGEKVAGRPLSPAPPFVPGDLR